MFSSLLRTARQLFASPATTIRTSRPRLESLEQRDVPTASLGAQLQYLKVAEFQTAMNDVAASYSAATTYFNESAAKADLVAAYKALVVSAQATLYQYKYGFETKAQAVSDLTIIVTAAEQVKQDYQTVDSYFTSQGPLGSLLSWNGQYLGNMPNFYTGANMMP